jgi:hypothetical protein
MLITKKNVVEHLKKGLVKTSMVYPITKDAHYIVEEELTIKLSNEEIIKIPKGFAFNGSSSFLLMEISFLLLLFTTTYTILGLNLMKLILN